MRPRWQRPVVLTAEQIRQLPAEPTAVVAARFGRTPGWLRQQRYLGRIQPTSAECRPLWWRPIDVYLLIHPDTQEKP